MPESPSEPWQPLTIYEVGEGAVSSNGKVALRCVRAGVTRKFEPAWPAEIGAQVIDRDSIVLRLSKVRPKRADVLTIDVGGERAEIRDEIEIYRETPGQFAVAIDTPEFYSDPIIISVETP